MISIKKRSSAKKFLGRSLLFGVMMLFQIVFLILAVISIGKNFFAIYASVVVLDVCLSLFIINSGEPSAYKLTWLVAISVFPLIGGAGYIFIRLSRSFPKSVERIYRQRSVKLLLQDNTVAEELFNECPEYFGLAKYVAEYGGYPVFRSEYEEYFPLGELQFEAMLHELEKAKKFIFMEFFIIRKGYMFGKIADILIKKAAEGVDVRLLYDGIGTGVTDCSEIIGRLEDGGVSCREFNPFRPFLSSVQNNRDHRKIVVIDGNTAFSGGTNLADEYINRIVRFGHWKDTAVMLKGCSVSNYTVMFLQLWNSVSEGELYGNYSFHADAEVFGKGFVQPFSDSPLDNETVGKNVYLELINSAQDYICITTPYFIPDDELLNALIFAAKRGVEVKLITPHIPDKKYVNIITRSFFPKLVRSGVKVYEYTPGFIHAKCCISDGKSAVIGSINFDYRSFYMHFETAVIFYKCGIIGEIKRDFDETVIKSRLITEEDCSGRSFWERFAGYLLGIFSPLF